jgi:NMD protein affecting ribosome stability and mRNA decay
MVHVTCDRCAKDTGKECPGGNPAWPHGLDQPMQCVVPREEEHAGPEPGKPGPTVRYLRHVHLCPDCVKSLIGWWKAGRA